MERGKGRCPFPPSKGKGDDIKMILLMVGKWDGSVYMVVVESKKVEEVRDGVDNGEIFTEDLYERERIKVT